MCRMWTCYAIILPPSSSSLLSFHFSFGSSLAADDAPARSTHSLSRRLNWKVVCMRGGGRTLRLLQRRSKADRGAALRSVAFMMFSQPLTGLSKTVNILIELITQWRLGDGRTLPRLVQSAREMGAITCSLSRVLWRRWNTLLHSLFEIPQTNRFLLSSLSRVAVFATLGKQCRIKFSS